MCIPGLSRRDGLLRVTSYPVRYSRTQVHWEGILLGGYSNNEQVSLEI